MKNIIYLLLLSSIFTNSQENISLSLFQDIKLLVMKDDFGNNAGTIDAIISLNLEGNQMKYYYFSVQPFYEFADLSGGVFNRYGVNGIWNFNKLIMDHLEIGTGIGIGMIHRPNVGTISYQFINQLNYEVKTGFYVSMRYEIVRRSDLVYLWNTKKPFKQNLSIGVIVKINK